MKKFSMTLVCFLCLIGNAQMEKNLLPSVQKMEMSKEVVKIKNAKTSWELGKTDAKRAKFIKERWSKFLSENKIKEGNGYSFRFICEVDEKIEAIKEPYEKMKAQEVYSLEIGAKETIIKSPSIRGIFYGIATLQQLFNKNELKIGKIEDFSAFAIRGFMIDVGRNYAPLEMLKTIADFMAKYKLNTFHWHFTDNYGWRLESKIHPQVNDPKSMSRMPGKIYTQAEFKEFVEYCRVRNILVIPEMDMPGHTESFRKAFNFSKMKDDKATQILTDLITELASLVPAENMPYIHLGTDEVQANESVDEATLAKYYAAVDNAGHRPLSWSPGLHVKGYNRPICQMWTGRRNAPPKNSDYIDSQENYLNHADPFEAASLLFFRKNCNFTHANGIGGILCWWPDIELAKPENHFTQSHIFSSMLFYCEAMWRNPHEHDFDLKMYSNLPTVGTPELAKFIELENRVLFHKEKYLQNLHFPYIKQSDIIWKISELFPNNGDVKKSFPVEEKISKEYEIEGKKYGWLNEYRVGATVLFKHYADYPTFLTDEKIGSAAPRNSTIYALTYFYANKAGKYPVWISGNTWSAAERRSGTACIEGEWFNTSPKFLVNDTAIPAPNWQKKNVGGEAPYIDENYWFREPTLVEFKKGWNKVLIKSPNNNTRRWMFTFVPITPPKKEFSIGVQRNPHLRPATPAELEKLIK